MTGHTRLMDPMHRCEACSTDMPGQSVRAFLDDGAVLFVCRDTEACEARRAARVAGTVEASFVMPALNRLMARVEELEAWRRSTIITAVPAAPATCPRCGWVE